MSYKKAMLFLFLSALCTSAYLWANRDTFDINAFVLEKYYNGDAIAFKRAKDQGSFKICGKYVVVDYGADVDGILWYLTKKDGEVYSTCGGTCMHSRGEKRIECRTKCPPSDFKCD